MTIPAQKIIFQTLELRFSQLLKTSDRSRSSKFSDNNKKAFHESLIKIIDKISKEDFSKFGEEKLFQTYHIIEQVFEWFEYIVDSTINQTPYEILFTLDEVLKEWINNREDFIILTSLSNKRDAFEFHYDKDPRLSREIKNWISNNYGVEIRFEIIRIVFPKFLSHDYFIAVSLYHELAHFIDWKYKIKDNILLQLPLISENRLKTEILYREYFADLFAAQYINIASCAHVSSLTVRRPHNSESYYPSTSQRIELVNKFLTGKNSEELENIKSMIKKCTGNDLKIRYKKIKETDFNNLIPTEIKESAQLHGLFIKAWEIWLNPKSNLRKKFKNKTQLYRILNNLVEKSISNFFLERDWRIKNVSN